MWSRLKAWVNDLKRDTLALWYVCRDRRTPWTIRLLGILIVGYALSPIDLIPDFIPILGYLDELVLLPAGLWLLFKLIPPELLSECRDKANIAIVSGVPKPRSMLGAALVIIVWIGLAYWLMHLAGFAFGT